MRTRYANAAQVENPPRVRSLFAFNPHADLARLFAGLDVDDARAAADGAVFGVRLPLAAAQVDGKLVGLPAERALYDSRRPQVSALCHAANYATKFSATKLSAFAGAAAWPRRTAGRA